jgi:UDP-N-acetyl-D-glucosamine dehydrogenase
MAISTLEQLYTDKKAKIGVIGMGYVGMPLALTAAAAGFAVIGFDIDAEKVAKINAGKSYIKHIASDDIATVTKQDHLRATDQF